MQALRLYAGPAALRHLHTQGLQARDVGIVAGAAGGPKGLIVCGAAAVAPRLRFYIDASSRAR